MSAVCNQCSRVNPSDATYCYWDGAILGGRGGRGGPINAGSAPFPNQFVFPSGQICRNFDQLALACQQHWQQGVELLKQGFLATFMGGLGRADLAMVANEAARFPDADRGMDQLLSRLPTNVLQAPKLLVEPKEVNLGQIAMGTDRDLEFHLTNLGMRLLYGSVAADCKWLALSDDRSSYRGAEMWQATDNKLLQFGSDLVLKVHVKGQLLRAGNRPLEGQLVFDTNGGAVTVTVRADVPISPFTEGVLAGSHTPRQIAEKAKLHPNAAAALFEKGLVAQWFGKNGWTYPVQGPCATGMAAVQQFFEALGLAKAPKVELKTAGISLRGDVGEILAATVEVTSPEKKPVYAHVVSDQPWVATTAIKCSGRKAVVHLAVTVPHLPGQTAQANLTVIGNGHQKFQIPLTLAVGGFSPFAGMTPIMAIPIDEPLVMALPADDDPITVAPMQAMPPPLPMAQVMAAPVLPASPFAGLGNAPAPALSPPPLPPMAISPVPPVPVPAAPMPALAITTPSKPVPVSAPAKPVPVGARPKPVPVNAPPQFIPAPPAPLIATRRKDDIWPAWMHLLPMGILALALIVLMVRDLVSKPPPGIVDGEDLDRTQRLAVFLNWGIEEGIRNTMTFGLVAVDPDNKNNPNPKKLTYDHRGRTNSTVLLIDDQNRVFGKAPFGKFELKPHTSGKFGGQTCGFLFTPEMVLTTQVVEIIPGEAHEVTPGEFRRALDTLLVKYKVENKDNKPHRVALRVMIDTLIGSNDGVPFTIPNQQGLVSTFRDFRTPAEIPDFIQALEEPNLERPGTTVQMNLRLSEKLAPDRVSLTLWPGVGGQAHRIDNYEVPIENIGMDSAIVMYWNAVDLGPGQSREMAFSYGLGNVSLQGGKLGITVGGTFVVNRELTVVGLVADPQPGQTAALELPPGLQFLPGTLPTQNVPAAEKDSQGKLRPSPVTWRIRAIDAGTHTLTVTTSNGLTQSRRITIKKTGIF